jgi:hypothetical protein
MNELFENERPPLLFSLTQIAPPSPPLALHPLNDAFINRNTAHVEVLSMPKKKRKKKKKTDLNIKSSYNNIYH